MTPHPSPLPQGAREQETCHSELVSGSHNSNDNAIAGLSWIIRGVGGVTSDQHLTGLRPTENPQARNDEDKPFNPSTVQLLNHPSLRKCVAFTLAEVLITLGIIGVVAAMTLPALINKSQEYILKQQFKKTYNTWSNALLKSYSNNGNSWYNCYYAETTVSTCEERDPVTGACTKYSEVVGFSENRDCPAFFESLKSIVKVIKVCENNAYANGCIPEMKGVDTVIASNSGGETESDDYDILAATSGCAAFRESPIKNNNPAWVLSDGTVVGFYPGLLGKIFWVDINGHKGPNKWGYDIFTFNFKGGGNRGVRLNSGGCMRAEKGGKSTEQMLKQLY